MAARIAHSQEDDRRRHRDQHRGEHHPPEKAALSRYANSGPIP